MIDGCVKVKYRNTMHRQWLGINDEVIQVQTTGLEKKSNKKDFFTFYFVLLCHKEHYPQNEVQVAPKCAKDIFWQMGTRRLFESAKSVGKSVMDL